MLEELGLTVARMIPTEHLAGLLNGTLTLHGGVIRGEAGRIVAHLAMPAASGVLDLAPGVGLVSGVLSNYQLASISQDVKRVLDLSLVNTALSGLGLVTSLAGFAYLGFKIAQVDKKLESVARQTKEIKQMLQSRQRAQLLEAVDSLRHAGLSGDADTRKHLLLQSERAFGELAHHYQSQMRELSDFREIEAAEEFYTLACLGNVMCTSDLGMASAAGDDMSRYCSDWTDIARQLCDKLLQLDEPARLLDARYVDELPTTELIGMLDFTNDTRRGVGWIDDLRRSLGKTTLFTSSVRVTEVPVIQFAKKLRARHDVLESYAAHFAFLAQRRISASYFAHTLQEELTREGAPLLWVTSAPAVAGESGV